MSTSGTDFSSAVVLGLYIEDEQMMALLILEERMNEPRIFWWTEHERCTFLQRIMNCQIHASSWMGEIGCVGKTD